MNGNLVRAFIALVLLAVGAALYSRTEWVDTEVVRPAQGELLTNPHYVAQALLRQLGGIVVPRESLTVLPPTHARLVLEAWNWDFFPDRTARLRAWVEQGGQLVIPGAMVDTKSFKDWLPMIDVDAKAAAERQAVEEKKDAEKEAAKKRDDPAKKAGQSIKDDDKDKDKAKDSTDNEDAYEVDPGEVDTDEADPDAPPTDRAATSPAAAASAAAAAATAADAAARLPCAAPGLPAVAALRSAARAREVSEPDSVPASYGTGRQFRLCRYSAYEHFEPRLGVKAQWAIEGRDGIEMLRVPLGRGSVTAISNFSSLFGNNEALRGDHALLLASAVQVRPGIEIWFLKDEAGDGFMVWLWRNAWPACWLGALALLLLWWRAAPRFGPRVQSAALPRRSMREQVRGTAEFLRQRGPASLHAAQRCALDESVAQRLRLPPDADDAQRASAIARATGLDAQALARALPLQPAKPRSAAMLASDLQTMESARRRLLAGSALARYAVSPVPESASTASPSAPSSAPPSPPSSPLFPPEP